MFSLAIVSILLGTIEIVVIAAIVGVALIAFGVFLYFTFFAHLRLKKIVNELSSSFELDHGRLFGQDAQFIRRLESISSVNLVYVDEYGKWRKDFIAVRDEDASAQAAINSLKDLVGSHRYKELKQYLPTARATIDKYHARVDELDKALHEKFLSEDLVAADILKEKEAYRETKQLFFSKQEQLSLVAESFERLFKKIDNLFEECDGEVESARYEEAKDLLKNKISPLIVESTKILRNLPAICVSISNVIPDKISSLKNRYEELSSQGYPLNHILLKSDIVDYEESLSKIADNVKALRLNGVVEQLDALVLDIESHISDFEEEIDARGKFEAESEGVYEKENELENAYYSLNHKMPKVREIYLITSDDSATLEEIKALIDKAGSAKRSLDAHFHSATKQPYTTLLSKLKALSKESEAAEAAMQAFLNHIASLKIDSEKAAKAVKEYNERLLTAEKEIRDFSLPELSASYQGRLDALYVLIDNLYTVLHTAPINVKEVDRLYDSLVSDGDAFIASVLKDKEGIKEAETAIVHANRYRANSSAIDNSLLQSENLFYKGDFANSLANSKEAIEQAGGYPETFR